MRCRLWQCLDPPKPPGFYRQATAQRGPPPRHRHPRYLDEGAKSFDCHAPLCAIFFHSFMWCARFQATVTWVEWMCSCWNQNRVLASVKLDFYVIESPCLVLWKGHHTRGSGVESKPPNPRSAHDNICIQIPHNFLPLQITLTYGQLAQKLSWFCRLPLIL